MRLFYHLLTWLYFPFKFHIGLSNISYSFYWSCWLTFWWLWLLKTMKLAMAMMKVEAPPHGLAAPILLPPSKQMWRVSECPWFYQQEPSMLYLKELSLSYGTFEKSWGKKYNFNHQLKWEFYSLNICVTHTKRDHSTDSYQVVWLQVLKISIVRKMKFLGQMPNQKDIRATDVNWDCAWHTGTYG